MSDFNSSLPVKTESPGDVIAKIADATVPSQQLAIDSSGRITTKLDDGAGNAITSQASGGQRALDVGINVAGVQIDPRQIRALTSGDTVTVVQPTGANLHVDIDNTVSVTQGTSPWVTSVNNLPATVDTNYGAVGASTIRTASEIGNATGAASFNNGATGAQTLRVAANLAVAGADVSATNPVPVTMEASPGTHVNDYKDAAAIAANATDNHDYTVTAGKTLHLTQVESSASGKARMQIMVETGVATGVFTTSFTQFNSTADTNMSVRLTNDISVAAGVRVRVAMQNRDNQAQDLYSTISGYEI